MKVTANARKTPVKVLLINLQIKTFKNEEVFSGIFHSPGPISRDSLVMIRWLLFEAFVYVLGLFVRALFSLETFLLCCSWCL